MYKLCDCLRTNGYTIDIDENGVTLSCMSCGQEYQALWRK